jgi:hypothetical protein
MGNRSMFGGLMSLPAGFRPSSRRIFLSMAHVDLARSGPATPLIRAVGDSEPAGRGLTKGSSVNPVWRHSLNADYPLRITEARWP